MMLLDLHAFSFYCSDGVFNNKVILQELCELVIPGTDHSLLG